MDAEPPPIVAPAPETPEPPKPNVLVPILHDATVLTVTRISEAILWPQPFAEPRSFGDHYVDTFTKPPLFDPDKGFMEWDGDRWTINTIGHGLLGSELYLRGRTCRLPWYGSLALAAGSTVAWEYLFEGNGVRPSALDLVYTPIAGLVFGEARYQLWKATDNGVVKAIADPFGELERAVGTPC